MLVLFSFPGHDMFGNEFGDFGGLIDGDFGGGMDDIEVPRAKSITFADDKDITEKSNMQVYSLDCSSIVRIKFNISPM